MKREATIRTIIEAAAKGESEPRPRMDHKYERAKSNISAASGMHDHQANASMMRRRDTWRVKVTEREGRTDGRGGGGWRRRSKRRRKK